MPATMNASTMAGPAYCAAALPVSTKIPVPMIAPMPSATRLTDPRVRLRVCVPSLDASACSSSIDLRVKRLIGRWVRGSAGGSLPEEVDGDTEKHNDKPAQRLRACLVGDEENHRDCARENDVQRW